jgi:putative flavoprotein involved in K+ transport
VHNRGVVESEPGLYFIGMYFLYALSSVLIGGVGRDAEHVATHMATHQPTGGPEVRTPANA